MQEELELIFDGMRTYELSEHAKKIGVKCSGNKNELINRLIAFYIEPDLVKNTFDNLNPYEKEYLEVIVKQKYNPMEKSLKEIDQKYQKSYFKLKSLNIFFIKKEVPFSIRRELDSLIPPYEIEYHNYVDNVSLNDHYGFIDLQDNTVLYVDEFIKYVNDKKIKLTNKKKMLPKKNCSEFLVKSNLLDFSRNVNKSIFEINDMEDTVVLLGLFELLVAAGVINNSHEYLELGKNYKNYIKLNKYEKIRFLLNCYLETDLINEIDLMNSGIYRYNDNDFSSARDFILDAIKKLEIDKWISVEDFIEQIRMKNSDFIRDDIGRVYRKDEYDNWFYPASYDEFEYPFIDICLIHFFGALGIIDVCFDVTEDDRGYREFLCANYIKLTPFGAGILNLTEVEEAVIINNIPIEIKNNKIYVPNDSISLEHQLFFDRFLTREKDSNYIIYDLSFKNIAKAVDLGITLEEILNYLQDNAEDMPNALIDKFKYYETILNKVKIKEVTVLEFSNDLKTKINNNQKLKKFILADNNEYVIIKGKNAKEVKKVIENDELFCLIDK